MGSAGAAALCHCWSQNHMQGTGSMEERNHCRSWEQKMSSSSSVFKAAAFHHTVCCLYWVLYRIIFNIGYSRSGL